MLLGALVLLIGLRLDARERFSRIVAEELESLLRLPLDLAEPSLEPCLPLFDLELHLLFNFFRFLLLDTNHSARLSSAFALSLASLFLKYLDF